MRFYRWHIVFALLLIASGLFVFQKMTDKADGDLRVAFVSKGYINTQYFKERGQEIDILLKDANGDGKKTSDIESYSSESLEKRITKLEEYIEEDRFDIYIADKEVFEASKDKEAFFKIDYMTKEELEAEALAENERYYAANVEGNTILKLLGVFDSENLYIASAAEKSDELSSYRKNGRNICLYLLENKEKYQN